MSEPTERIPSPENGKRLLGLMQFTPSIKGITPDLKGPTVFANIPGNGRDECDSNCTDIYAFLEEYAGFQHKIDYSASAGLDHYMTTIYLTKTAYKKLPALLGKTNSRTAAT